MMLVPAWLEEISDCHFPSANTPQWLAKWRDQHWNKFNSCGIPTKKQDRFKYTDFDFLQHKNFALAEQDEEIQLQAVVDKHRLNGALLVTIVNGYFSKAYSDMQQLEKLSKQFIACSLKDAISAFPELIKKHWPQMVDEKKYPFASLAIAFSDDGLFLYLPEKHELPLPLHILSITTSDNEISTPQHLFVLEAQSKLTILEEHISLAEQSSMHNSVTHFFLNNAAKLEHIKVQRETKKTIHMAHHFVEQMQDSETNFVNFSFGASFARDDLAINLLGVGAKAKAGGLYRADLQHQYIDNHIDIAHLAAHTQSEMLYKGVIAANARAVFNGKVYVQKDAQKIIAHQANHNLLLSNQAEVYSKPELEIYADDVKCKHGATTGQLDQDAIFYMRARGIPEQEAIHILLQGFAEEMLERITHAGIKMRVQEGMAA